ncbi:MAG TPA: hypothetical protein VFJ90_12540, partial [Candidatus Didemnitutus sp.]|nr:hypothetical protein [Candidatus Didemnitutus sp.]
MQLPARPVHPAYLRRLLVVLVSGACSAVVSGDDRAAGGQSIEGVAFGEFGSPATASQPVSPVMRDEKGGDLVIAPIPTRSPSQGWGLTLVGQYIFKDKDQQSGTPPSIIGAGGFYTEQKSYGAFAGYLGHWKDDVWRPIFGGGYAHLNYDFYGIGNDAAAEGHAIPVRQDIGFVLAQMMRRVQTNLYGGLRVVLADIDTKFPNAGGSVP